MKKADDGHKNLDDGKKDGMIHDGIIREESISEVGSQEELFHSKEGTAVGQIRRVFGDNLGKSFAYSP